jgi:hypothetical protein
MTPKAAEAKAPIKTKAAVHTKTATSAKGVS